MGLNEENADGDDGWLAELVEDDELGADEAGFIAGYIMAEEEGFS